MPFEQRIRRTRNSASIASSFMYLKSSPCYAVQIGGKGLGWTRQEKGCLRLEPSGKRAYKPASYVPATHASREQGQGQGERGIKHL